MTEFKIGDIVRFNESDLKGTGEILGLAFDHALCKGWIVGIITRDTEFLKNRPEKAWIVIESQMKVIKKENEIIPHSWDCQNDNPLTIKTCYLCKELFPLYYSKCNKKEEK